MELYSWILQNREIIKIIYALIIVIICGIITLKSHRMFKLSMYQGIRYFRNAFFFYGIAFVVRYFLGSSYLPFKTSYGILFQGLFSFFFIMAGFFLLYSLLWKKVETSHAHSSLFNFRLAIFYIMALILVILDSIWGHLYLLFYSQALVFLFAFAISFKNYKSKGRNRKFLKFYALAMLIALVAWTLNAFIEMIFKWDPNITIIIYLLNIFMFLLFLFGIMRVSKGR